jgi:hypothetical protein
MGKNMKKFACATLAAGGLSALTVGLGPPAVAAPSGTSNARDTISSLEAQGYNVIVNKIGDTPLDEADVVAVRNGREITQRVNDIGGDTIEKVLYTTVYVDVK